MNLEDFGLAEGLVAQLRALEQQRAAIPGHLAILISGKYEFESKDLEKDDDKERTRLLWAVIAAVDDFYSHKAAVVLARLAQIGVTK